jgi:hypothetical protein
MSQQQVNNVSNGASANEEVVYQGSNGKSVLVLGAGHLANRTRKLILEKGYTVIHFSRLFSNDYHGNSSSINEIKSALNHIDLSQLSMTYVLYESDEDNLEMVIAFMAINTDIPIATSLFNENIRPHLEAANPNLQILNPAKLVAPIFVGALDKAGPKRPLPTKKYKKERSTYTENDYLIKFLVITFVLIATGSVIYFHIAEALRWLDAAYFVVASITTVGYGDINLLKASDTSKVVDIFMVLSSVAIVSLVFSLILDRIIKQRAQYAMGRKTYAYKNHIVVCGLGRLGYFIVEELLQRGEKIVIIESDEHSPNIAHFRAKNVDVYIGDARLPKVQQDVGVESCHALLSVTNDDYANLEIGLNARHFRPDVCLILRIFDESMAEIIREKFDINLTESMSFLAAQEFCSLVY